MSNGHGNGSNGHGNGSNGHGNGSDRRGNGSDGHGNVLDRREAIRRYEGAAAILPSPLRKLALTVPEEYQARAEEIRLRAGYPMTILLCPECASGQTHSAGNVSGPGSAGNVSEWDGPGNASGPAAVEWIVDSGRTVEPEDLETLCDLAAEFSRYAAVHTLREGYLPVRGGYRVGLCGSAVVKDGANTNLTRLSSAVVRIARQHKGIARPLVPRLFRDGEFVNTLLLSGPGGGKTTLLRDIIREVSDGAAGYGPRRVALIDERGEVAVMYMGRAQMDIGAHTDVLDGCPKALGIPMVLRAMNPQIIAVDEITLREDLRAMIMAAGCGIRLLATIHAADISDLTAKPLYRELLAEGVFRLAVRITTGPDGRCYEVEDLFPIARETSETESIMDVSESGPVREESETETNGLSESDGAEIETGDSAEVKTPMDDDTGEIEAEDTGEMETGDSGGMGISG